MLVIDETGDRKDGTNTDHVGYQYLGSIGRIANGIVSVSSVWADGRIYYPLDVEPYTPAKRLEKGRSDPAFRTKPQIAVELVKQRPSSVHTFPRGSSRLPLRREPGFEGTMWKAKVPYVLSLRPHKGRWAEEEAAHTPEEAAQRMGWNSEEDPGAWEPIVRTFKDGHTREMVGGGGHHAHQLRSGEDSAPGSGYYGPRDAASQQQLVSGDEPASPGLRPGTRIPVRGGRSGGGGKTLRPEAMGGAELQADQGRAGILRLPGQERPCHPKALGVGLLRLLVSAGGRIPESTLRYS